MNYFIETLLGVFTIDKGEIRVLLMKRKTDPYKGYWCLPGDLLKEETLDDNIKMITNNLGIPSLYLKQTKSPQYSAVLTSIFHNKTRSKSTAKPHESRLCIFCINAQ